MRGATTKTSALLAGAALTLLACGGGNETAAVHEAATLRGEPAVATPQAQVNEIDRPISESAPRPAGLPHDHPPITVPGTRGVHAAHEGAYGSVDLGDAIQVPLRPEPEPLTRARKRMDIDQLTKAIQRATGGIGWTSSNGADRFAQLAATLGAPDYAQITAEDLTPGALFQKFLDDAARAVCDELVQLELEREPSERVLIAEVDPEATVNDDPQGVEANLRALLFRYHAKHLEPGAPGLHTWKWLFESASFVAGSPTEGWRAVCIGLIVHPDFYTY